MIKAFLSFLFALTVILVSHSLFFDGNQPNEHHLTRYFIIAAMFTILWRLDRKPV